jgi:hypothetical protein
METKGFSDRSFKIDNVKCKNCGSSGSYEEEKDFICLYEPGITGTGLGHRWIINYPKIYGVECRGEKCKSFIRLTYSTPKVVSNRIENVSTGFTSFLTVVRTYV